MALVARDTPELRTQMVLADRRRPVTSVKVVEIPV